MVLCPTTLGFSAVSFVGLLAVETCVVLFDWAYAFPPFVAVAASVEEVSKSSSSRLQRVVFICSLRLMVFVA